MVKAHQNIRKFKINTKHFARDKQTERIKFYKDLNIDQKSNNVILQINVYKECRNK